MGLVIDYIDGQTPLDEEEKDGLLIPTIATRGELDEFEQQNIEQAVQWTLGRSFKPELFFSPRLVFSPSAYGGVRDISSRRAWDDLGEHHARQKRNSPCNLMTFRTTNPRVAQNRC